MSELSAPSLDMTPWMKIRIGARLLLLQARWDSARMQGPGFCFAIDPWLAVCWGSEPEALREARRRHLEYFNTHPVAAWLMAGIVCRHEAAAAALSGAAREQAIKKIRSLKTGLGASLAGLYDSFFWGALRPASALAGILVAQAAYRFGWRPSLAWAAATALCVYNVPGVTARVFGLLQGAGQGERAATGLIDLPVQSWIRGLRWAAVGGAMLAFGFSTWTFLPGDRLMAAFLFAAGLILTWRGVSQVAQLGLAGLGGMAASVVGIWP